MADMVKKVLPDYTGMKVSQVKAAVRAQIMEDFFEFLQQKYKTYGQVAAGEIALYAATFTDEDGFPHDVPAVIKVTAKPFYDSVGEKGRETEPYDVEEEIKQFKLAKAGQATRHKGRPKKSAE